MKKFLEIACVTLISFAALYILFAIVLWILAWISSTYEGIIPTRIMYVIFSLFLLYTFASYKIFVDDEEED